MTWLLFIKKFWPFGVIIVLAFAVLFMRNTITDRTAERDAAKARVADVTEANAGLKRALELAGQARIDNDAIAEAVALKLKGTQARVVEYRTTIEKVKANDPVVRAWGVVPVPSRVREALRAREGHSDAP